MTPDALYTLLINANEVTTCDPFDGHVLACIFATAVNEHLAGGSFTNALGIFGSALRRDIERYFPGALQRIEMFELDIEPTVTEDDKCLRELLWRFRSASSPISSLLTFLVARRAKSFMAGSWAGESRRVIQAHVAPLHRIGASQQSGHEMEEIPLSNDLPRGWIQHVCCPVLLRVWRLRCMFWQ
jgi:hypothetical protein